MTILLKLFSHAQTGLITVLSVLASAFYLLFKLEKAEHQQTKFKLQKSEDNRVLDPLKTQELEIAKKVETDDATRVALENQLTASLNGGTAGAGGKSEPSNAGAGPGSPPPALPKNS